MGYDCPNGFVFDGYLFWDDLQGKPTRNTYFETNPLDHLILFNP